MIGEQAPELAIQLRFDELLPPAHLPRDPFKGNSNGFHRNGPQTLRNLLGRPDFMEGGEVVAQLELSSGKPHIGKRGLVGLDSGLETTQGGNFSQRMTLADLARACVGMEGILAKYEIIILPAA